MQVGSYWIITMQTIKGPWQVTSKGNYWYVFNILTYTIKKIGKVKGHGLNFCNRAKEIARERNAVFFSKKENLPLYIGKYPELDEAISEVLKQPEGAYV